jgi:F0F1-type ATP synthase assembly protein I
MGKAAAKKETTSAEADIQRALDTFNAKQQFFTSALNMSWQLALTIVIPVVAGVKLDAYLDSSPSLTLTGFFLAIAMGGTVVWSTVKGVNKAQAEEDSKKLTRRKRVK